MTRGTAAVRLLARHPWPMRAAGAVAVVGGFAAVPQLVSGFYASLALNVLIFGLLAMSLDLLAGYAGLLSFGHAAWLGLGAYAIGYAEHRMWTPWQSVGFAFLAVTVVALAFGLIAVRVTGLTFGIVTMALGGILWGLAFRWVAVSGGDNGLPISFRPKIGGLDLTNGKTYYYAVLVVFVVCAVLMRTIVASPFGLTLRGIMDNEGRMRTLGYSVGLHKYLGYVLSALFGGVAGMLYGFYNLYVGPAALDMSHNFLTVMMVVLGGMGTLWGGLVGAAVVVSFQQWVSLYVDRWSMVLGAIFILTILFARRGLYGTLLAAWRGLVRRHEPRDPLSEARSPSDEQASARLIDSR
jgi:branched-chain amino acid transport system permease protein